MRVVLSGWFWDRQETGSGQYVRRLLEALAPMVPPTEIGLLLPRSAQVTVSGIAGILLPAPPGNLGKVWWEQVQVPLATRRLGAQVLHVPYWAPPLLKPLPTLVTLHDLIPLLLREYRGGIGVRLYTALVSAAAARADCILTDSSAARSDILRALRVPEERVRAIPLAAADLYSPIPAAEDAATLKTLNLTPGYFLYLGGFDVRKDLSTLVAGFAQARSECPEARLVIAGQLPAADTAFTPDPRRLVREARLPAAAVTFTGWIAEESKPALYRNAHALLYPSRYEGFGLPPLEALACGIPVVASHATSLPEVVGAAGILTPPGDSAALGAALVRLLTQGDLRAHLAQAASAQAARFSWQTTARETLAAYQKWL